MARSQSRRPRLAAAVLALTLVAYTVGVLGFSSPADAAEVAVAVTPATASTQSGSAAQFTLSYSCSVTGGCTGTTVTIPTGSVTGDGSTTDFAGWLKNGSCPNLTATGGQAKIVFGTVATGSAQCNFTVTPPEYLTRNGATASLTPTISGTNFTSLTGAAATLTATAGHNIALGKTVSTAAVPPGRNFYWNVQIFCSQNHGGPDVGDVGTSAVTITDQLPTGFTYTSFSMPLATPPAATGTYNSATHTFTYDDPSGATCADPKYGMSSGGLPGGGTVQIYVHGTATTDGTTPDALGTRLCNTASAQLIYVDATPASATSPQTCTTVTAPVNNQFVTKSSLSGGEYNGGQYTMPGYPSGTPYTYPGDWDRTGNSAQYIIKLLTNGTGAGVDFAVQDPLPCLDNLTGSTYSSLAPGSPYCAHPAFVPTKITATAFTPSASDSITAVHPDGTSDTIPFAGDGWTISPAQPVAEFDIPPFPEEGDNTNSTIQFSIQGYAASATTTPSALKNTVTANAYDVGSSVPLTANPATFSAGVIVAGPDAPSGTVVDPIIEATYRGGATCQENVYLQWAGVAPEVNTVEIASAPSKAIYIDYLAPSGGILTTGRTTTFTVSRLHNNGSGLYQQTTIGTASTPPITATVTDDFHGTGRSLYEWVIPAGTIAATGMYGITPSPNWVVTLPSGCAGTQQNDLTMGYDGPVTSCLDSTGIYLPPAKPVPNPPADPDLQYNGTPATGQWCGMSSKITIAPVNPGFRVEKTVQGNLDPAPTGAGGTGNVSPTGGTATYQLTFTNTGQSNLTDPVMYDLLPRVGDTQASSTTPRGSQFGVSLADIGALPPEVTVYYSTATNPCRPEVLPTNPGCADDWSTTRPASPAQTTALKFAYSGTISVSGASGTHEFSVSFTVSTPDTTPGKIAWNTVGTNVFAGDNLMGAAESSRTGLQAETGPTIAKSASVPDYSGPNDNITYTFTVGNNTAVPLTGVGVTDNFTDSAPGSVAPLATCMALSNPSGSCSGLTTDLAPGQLATFTADYPVAQADLDHGLISDIGTVTARPPAGGTLTNTSNEITVNVRPAVTAVADTDTTTARTAVDTDVLANDRTNSTAFPLDPRSVTVTTEPGSGSATPNAGGVITYTPLPGFSGIDNYAYRVCDTAAPTPVCDTASVIITVANVFIDRNVQITTPQNTTITTALSDIVTTQGAPVDPTSVTRATAPQHGSISIDAATGAVTYTPNPGYTGPDGYEVHVCDTTTPTPQCHVSPVGVSVGANQVVANDDADTTAAQTPVTTDVRANDTTLTGQPFADPTVTLDAADGTTSVNPDGTVTYSPAPGFSGTDEYVYRVCDTSNPVPICDTATVTITVTNVFVAGGAEITTPQNTPVTTSLDDIVTTKGEPIDPASVGQNTAPQHGAIVIDAATGAVTYTPVAGYTGPDVYVINVCDTTPGTPACDTATVHVTVLPDEVVVHDQDVTTRVDHPVHHIDVLSDANSTSGQPLHDPTIDASPIHGTAAVNPGGSITYTPAPGYVGRDAFTFTVCDTGDPQQACDTGTIRVTVTPVADLSTSKKLDTADIVAGRSVKYTTTLRNLGPSAATNVHSIDPIRSIVTNVRGTPDPGVQHTKCVTRATTSDDLARLSPDFGPYTLTEYPTVVDCTYQRIAAGVSVHDTITGTVAPDSGEQSVVNQAAVFADTYDPDLTNNIGIAKGRLATGADLTLTKRVDDRSVSVGDEVTFRITVTNHGPSTAIAVQAQDTPTGMSFVSAHASQGSYDGAAGVWHLGSLAPGRTVRLTTVEKVTATSAHNVATVQSRTADSRPGNNGGGDCSYGARGCGSVDLQVSGESSSNPPSGGEPPDGSGGPPSSSGTADTGIDVRMLCVLGGLLLAAGGGFLLAARRRAA